MNRLRRTQLWLAMESLLVGSLIVPAVGHAQTTSSSPVTPEDEYPQLVKAAQKIAPSDQHPFGERINLYDGTLSFEVTDISVPGIGPVLQLGRTLKTLEASESSPFLNWQRPFGEWDLDIPRIETNTADETNDTGWYVASDGSPGYMNRCSRFGPPPVVTTDWGIFDADEYWYGYHLLIPGEGSQELLGHSSGAPHSPASGSFPVATKRDWMISCGVTASDGGEGFVALAPDGTRYTFTQLVYRPMAEVELPLNTQPYAAPAVTFPTEETLSRRDAIMYVTKVEDRFGNTLNYNWSGNNLTSIVASDGRKVSLTYVSGTPLVQTITVDTTDTPARSWRYNYSYNPEGVPTLTSVQLPDGSAWAYQLGTLESGVLATRGGVCDPGAAPPAQITTGGGSGSMTAPSGLSATFTVNATQRGRSYVPPLCVHPQGTDYSWAAIPILYTPG